jgi:hypothetical protein
MAQVYTKLSRTQRHSLQQGFLAYVQKRDGQVDLAREWLSHREAYFEQNESRPVRSAKQIDRAKFTRNLSTTKIEPDLDEVMLWLLATAKANRSERYGIEISKRTRLGGNKAVQSANEPLVYLTVEEFYHTRVLLDAVKVFGVDFEMAPPASRFNRLAIGGMVYLPEKVSAPLALAGEVLGVIAFTLLRDKAAQLFADEPPVVERVQSLYNQILVDEIGHVAYARATNGWLGLKVAELIQPILVRAMLREVPELVRLFGTKQILDEIKRIDFYMQANNLPATPYSFSPA